MSQPSPAAPREPQPYRYGGKVLAAFVAVYVLALWLVIVGQMSTLVAVIAVLVWGYSGYIMLAVDWRGYTSLNGRIVWSRLSDGKKILWFIAIAFMPEFTCAVYFFFAVSDHYIATHTSPPEQIKTAWHDFKSAPRKGQAVQATALALALVAFFSMTHLDAVSASILTGDTAATAQTTSTNTSSATSTTASSATSATSTTQPVATDTPSPTATSVPTATNTPAPQINPTGPAVIGGTVDDYKAKYGPTETSVCPNGETTCFENGHLQVTTDPFTNDKFIDIVMIGNQGQPWTPSAAHAICVANLPGDAHYQKQVPIVDSQGTTGVVYLYYSASLANEFPANDFNDSSGNNVQPGTVEIQYLYSLPNDDSQIDDCQIDLGTQDIS